MAAPSDGPTPLPPTTRQSTFLGLIEAMEARSVYRLALLGGGAGRRWGRGVGGVRTFLF